ncbi:YjbF family lipoprotein [Puniceibacterium sp. IMCC21224]|uniref:YjbF family lipoprotein n=1 Tax=Puniceibacterium sp. IMCC21224 TaxID=1618204 RepID=UPI00065CEE83|nr:YjbF family lipoprotein [Puniceibacterium sp. IMCC21224]KMK65394.1 Group 4 capsule polysaccharide formation lipoprotein gfcB [Puniceibacterium sp. IMCC21224]
MRYAIAALTVCAVLAGCGNETKIINPAFLIRDVAKQAMSGGNKDGFAVSKAQIDTGLNFTPLPLAMVTIEKRKGQALMLEVEQNGPYRTYATADRQSFTLRGGILTATRGIGDDLMSTDNAGLVQLVQARRDGTAPYILRLLDGENITRTLNFTCEVFSEGSESYALGQISANATKMIANCTGDMKPFTDTFLVDGSGHVIEARQWVGETTEYITVQALRK